MGGLQGEGAMGQRPRDGARAISYSSFLAWAYLAAAVWSSPACQPRAHAILGQTDLKRSMRVLSPTRDNGILQEQAGKLVAAEHRTSKRLLDTPALPATRLDSTRCRSAKLSGCGAGSAAGDAAGAGSGAGGATPGRGTHDASRPVPAVCPAALSSSR